MQGTYVRIHGKRERYETLLVEALVAIGYEVALSSDLVDEILGEDARDHEFDIGWDFFIGAEDSPYLMPKLKKALDNGVGVFHVPAEIVDDLCLPSRRQLALSRIADLYESALEQVKTWKFLRRSADLARLEADYFRTRRPVLQVA